MFHPFEIEAHARQRLEDMRSDARTRDLLNRHAHAARQDAPMAPSRWQYKWKSARLRIRRFAAKHRRMVLLTLKNLP